MLVFLHLSDLHITTEDAGTQFDRDLRIREALLEDLGKEGRTNFDAILVTGDIAYNGRADEFTRAKSWLEEVRKKTHSNPEALFTVPGNHDVNRATVAKSSSLWDLHQLLRDSKGTPEDRAQSLRAKLKDPSLDFLAGLKEYRNFANDYACSTTCQELAWVQFLNSDRILEDGTIVRFHGLNSSILSDESDLKANLLLGEFQFAHFDLNPSHVNVVLCHHPHIWLIDGNESNDFFRSSAHIVLCGHEHDPRCYKEGGSVRLYAGAIHPNRREQRWEPCYHVLRLSLNPKPKRELCISIETRVWREKDKRFSKYVQGDGSDFYEERIPLPEWQRPPSANEILNSANKGSTLCSGSEVKTANMTQEAFSAARRKLIVHFFRIGTLSRFHAAVRAGVWEEGDDAFDGQARWARVFERAEREAKLGSLWDAVAESDESLKGQINPFTTQS